jgi:hypothetical protein
MERRPQGNGFEINGEESEWRARERDHDNMKNWGWLNREVPSYRPYIAAVRDLWRESVSS